MSDFIKDDILKKARRSVEAARYAAEFGGRTSADTVSMYRNTNLSVLSAETVMKEIKQVFTETEKPSVFFEELRRMNLLDVWFPELKQLIGVKQNETYHMEGDVWTHTMLVVDEAAKRRENAKCPVGLMFSALCHDFGKAVCTMEVNGVLHAYGHETEGLPLVRKFLERLNTDTELLNYVLNMTELHMQPNIMARAKSKLKSTNRLFDSAVEPYDLVLLSICDGMGKVPMENGSEQFLMQRYKKYNEIMSMPYVEENDLIEAGFKESSQIREILSYAHKMRLAGCNKENSLRQSIAYAEKVLKIKR